MDVVVSHIDPLSSTKAYLSATTYFSLILWCDDLWQKGYWNVYFRNCQPTTFCGLPSRKALTFATATSISR